jgi:hypothetical protein
MQCLKERLRFFFCPLVSCPLFDVQSSKSFAFWSFFSWGVFSLYGLLVIRTIWIYRGRTDTKGDVRRVDFCVHRRFYEAVLQELICRVLPPENIPLLSIFTFRHLPKAVECSVVCKPPQPLVTIGHNKKVHSCMAYFVHALLSWPMMYMYF